MGRLCLAAAIGLSACVRYGFDAVGGGAEAGPDASAVDADNGVGHDADEAGDAESRSDLDAEPGVPDGGSGTDAEGADGEVFDDGMTGPTGPPAITASCASSAEEDIDYACDPSAVDPDGDALGEWSTAQVPNPCAWASIDVETGAIRGRPTATDVGVCTLAFSVVDVGGNRSQVHSTQVTVAGTAPRVGTLLFQRASVQTTLCSGFMNPPILLRSEADRICSEDLGPGFRVAAYGDAANDGAFGAALERPPAYTGNVYGSDYVFAALSDGDQETSYFGSVGTSPTGSFVRGGACDADVAVPVLCSKPIHDPTVLGSGSRLSSRAIAYDEIGNRYGVAWRGPEGEIWFRTIDAASGRALSGLVQLGSSSTGPPQLAFQPQTSRYLVIWKETSDRLTAALVDEIARVEKAAFTVTSGLYDNGDLSIAVAADGEHGRFLVAYSGRYSIEPWDIDALHARFYDGHGVPHPDAPAAFVMSNTTADFGLGNTTGQIDLVYHPELDVYATLYPRMDASDPPAIETLVMSWNSVTPGPPTIHPIGSNDRVFRLVPSLSLTRRAFLLLFATPDAVYSRPLDSGTARIPDSEFELNVQTVWASDLHGLSFADDVRYPTSLRERYFISWSSMFQYLDKSHSRTVQSTPDRVVTTLPRCYVGEWCLRSTQSASALNTRTGGLAHVAIASNKVTVRLLLPDASPY